jgi:Secretion system C-terminal sorting domain
MKNKIILWLIALICPFLLLGQDYQQYFDGADTSAQNALFLDLNSDTSSIWQIGPPQKTIFESASTLPNALLTDTIHFYPPSDSSSFYITINPDPFGWGILALQWNQKLDYESGADGGAIEFTTDGGTTWGNVFNSPYVYNFYGFDPGNQDTLSDGTLVFSGTDTLWKNVWLCFDMTWLSFSDSLVFRFSSISDTTDTQQEGWMLDNFIQSITFVHTVSETPQEKYLEVFPNPTTGRVFIQAQKIDGFHIIEEMELSDASGKTIQRYGITPTKFFIDLDDVPAGMYYLRVQTNLQTETIPILKQ